MLTEHIRDAAMTAVIFGFFTTVWFGWAQETRTRKVLLGGVAAGVLVLLGGLAIAIPHWSDSTAFADADTSRTYGIIVGIEFTVAGLGAGLLGALKRVEWIPVWVAFVVGVHLFSIASTLDYPLIHVIGVLVTAVSLLAVPVARARELPVSLVTGVGAGTSLLAGALTSLILALTAY
ncbi:hypothetical protein [Catenuloplanes japonicus]|uniref:hypothetical protein n=1 Tax=Catenuloplanes japonicus TaxID=33876 RepID=UPI00052659E0|nr:hypothetical protein [Catenuloplanes japonicus]